MRSAAAQWELDGPRITGPMTSLKMLGETGYWKTLYIHAIRPIYLLNLTGTWTLNDRIRIFSSRMAPEGMASPGLKAGEPSSFQPREIQSLRLTNFTT
jgi:hypothetical protein